MATGPLSPNPQGPKAGPGGGRARTGKGRGTRSAFSLSVPLGFPGRGFFTLLSPRFHAPGKARLAGWLLLLIIPGGGGWAGRLAGGSHPAANGVAAPYSRWRSPASLSEPSPPEELDTSRGSVASAPGYGWAAARPSPSSARGSASPPPDPGESGKCSQSSPLRFRAGASQPSLRLAQDANLGWGGRDGVRRRLPGKAPLFLPVLFPSRFSSGGY